MSADTRSRSDGGNADALSPSSAPCQLPLELVGPRDAKGFIVPTPTPDAPAFVGRWDIDYTCACCGRIICKNVKAGLFSGMIFRCVGCRKLNRVPGAPARLSAFP